MNEGRYTYCPACALIFDEISLANVCVRISWLLKSSRGGEIEGELALIIRVANFAVAISQIQL